MNDFEHDLRTAFARRADAGGHDATHRVCAVDYRPRTRRVTGPRVAGLVGTASAASAVAAVALVGGTSASAFAGWTPKASTEAGPSTTVANACQARLSDLPGDSGTTWTPVVTESDGPFTLVAYQGGSATAFCLDGHHMIEVATQGGASASALGGSSTGSGGTMGGFMFNRTSTSNSSSGDLRTYSTSQHSTSSGDDYTVALGEVASGVTGVTLVRNDGTHMTAGLEDGWFVAWWPGTATATSAQLSTASGTVTVPLNTSTPPGGSGASGASGSGTSGSASSSSQHAGAGKAGR